MMRISRASMLRATARPFAAVALCSVYFTGCVVAAENTASTESDVLATVAGVAITRAEVQAAVASDLQKLERERHQVMERGLENLINDKLLEVEAEARGMTAQEVVEQEMAARVAAITDEEVDAFYEAQKARIGRPKEQVEGQIRQYLASQRTQQARQGLLEGLGEKYEVRRLLEPLRIDVAIAGLPQRGPDDAPVTIVEFSDFQCPFCSRITPTLDRIQEEYGDRVRLLFRHFPLHNIHPQAQKAAEASLCAAEQERFWEMHDAMFADQKGLSVDELKEKAAALSLDAEVFAECLDSGRMAQQVEADLEAGREAGVTGTPALFVNGRFLSGAQPFEEIAKIVDDELERVGG